MLSFTDPAVTPTEATAYHDAAGATGWPTDTADQSAAIMRGQRYIAARFNSRWLTDWDNDDAPDEVKYAISEAALAEAVKPGVLNPTSTPATDKVLTGVGSLTWERVKGAAGADGYIPRIAAVDGVLAGLVRSGGVAWVNRA